MSLRRFCLAMAVGSAVGALGCPGTQVKNSAPPPVPALAGAWESACLPMVNADDTDGWARVVVGITPTLWAMDRHLFADDACSAATGTVHIDGGYALEEPSTVVPGAWNARFDFRTRTITPHVDGFIAYLQSLSCGESFGVDRATDVMDVACPALGFRAFETCQADLDVVAVDGNTLRLGLRPADGDVCSPARRPSVLGPPLQRIP
jgi:hypothetical protein